jgi:hypothetical protein
VRARICSLLTIAGLLVGSLAGGAEPAALTVKVKSGGIVCVVKGIEAKCSAIAVALANTGATRADLVSVSPEACGERALDEARSVADRLKAQGFSKVALVGMLTEPGRKCAP